MEEDLERVSIWRSEPTPSGEHTMATTDREDTRPDDTSHYDELGNSSATSGRFDELGNRSRGTGSDNAGLSRHISDGFSRGYDGGGYSSGRGDSSP